MGIKSKENWSGTVINGVTLGEPAIHEDGTFEWDGGVPTGSVDEFGDFTPEGKDDSGKDLPKESLTKDREVKFPEPKKDKDGQPVGSYTKGAIISVDDKIYRASKDGISFDSQSKDWVEVVSKEPETKVDKK